MAKRISKRGELHGRPATVWKVFVLAGMLHEWRGEGLTTSEGSVTAVRGRRFRTWIRAVRVLSRCLNS